MWSLVGVFFIPDHPISVKDNIFGIDCILTDKYEVAYCSVVAADHSGPAAFDRLTLHVTSTEWKAGWPVSYMYGALYHLPSLGSDQVKLSGTGKRIEHRSIEFGEWNIRIESYGPKIKWSRKTPQITHRFFLAHKDNTSFEPNTAQRCLDFLHYFLMLLAGVRSGPGVCFGFRDDGSFVYSTLSVYKIDQLNWPDTWVPSMGHHAVVPDRQPFELADLIWKIMLNQDRANWLTVLIATYCDACRRESGSEHAVFLAQSGMELLGSLLLVDSQQILSSSTWRRMPAAEKMRLLLSRASIDTSLPDDLKHLISNDVTDGPDTIVMLRNALTHPTGKNIQALSQLEGRDRFEIWRLSVHYLELLILHTLGYSGGFNDRVRGHEPGNVSKIVPWQ